MLVKVEEAAENYVQANMAAPRAGYAHLGCPSQRCPTAGVNKLRLPLRIKDALLLISWRRMCGKKRKIDIYRNCNCSQKISL
jgi:hypothetical protein